MYINSKRHNKYGSLLCRDITDSNSVINHINHMLQIEYYKTIHKNCLFMCLFILRPFQQFFSSSSVLWNVEDSLYCDITHLT